jgi:hypothetical protein
VATFLRILPRNLRGHVILLRDAGQIHTGPHINVVRDAYRRFRLERFSGRAPELNAAEQVWNDFKGHTDNSLMRKKQEICLNLHASARYMRCSGDKLRSLALSSELPSVPW